jgi:hypothetical protein
VRICFGRHLERTGLLEPDTGQIYLTPEAMTEKNSETAKMKAETEG